MTSPRTRFCFGCCAETLPLGVWDSGVMGSLACRQQRSGERADLLSDCLVGPQQELVGDFRLNRQGTELTLYGQQPLDGVALMPGAIGRRAVWGQLGRDGRD